MNILQYVQYNYIISVDRSWRLNFEITPPYFRSRLLCWIQFGRAPLVHVECRTFAVLANWLFCLAFWNRSYEQIRHFSSRSRVSRKSVRDCTLTVLPSLHLQYYSFSPSHNSYPLCFPASPYFRQLPPTLPADRLYCLAVTPASSANRISSKLSSFPLRGKYCKTEKLLIYCCELTMMFRPPVKTSFNFFSVKILDFKTDYNNPHSRGFT